MQELALLSTALQGIKNIDAWEKTINLAVTYESDIPDLNLNTNGRDYLFEIFLAGLLNASDVKVEQGEPDIVCERAGYLFTVAAKRIKSQNGIIRNVIKARQQIVAVGKPGIIAVDLSPMLPDYGGPFVQIPAHLMKKYHHQFLFGYFE